LEVRIIKDANGNVLKDGDSVSVIKDLKIKGTQSVVKVGTKVKNIRLCDGDHDIEVSKSCKVLISGLMLSFGCGKGSRFICSFLKIST
jgi:alkylphosphonate utilization operon protein PhnA